VGSAKNIVPYRLIATSNVAGVNERRSRSQSIMSGTSARLRAAHRRGLRPWLSRTTALEH